MQNTEGNASNRVHPAVSPGCFLNSIFPSAFSDEKHLLALEGNSFEPPEGCGNFPLNWEAVERVTDRNWRMQLQSWTFFHPVMDFFDSCDDKDAVLDFFFDLAKDWWAVYGDDPADIVTSRMPESYAWYDMSVGFRALTIAFFMDRIDGFGLEIEPARRRFLNELARKHVANLATPETFSLNNHGIFQAHGLMALLQMLPEDDRTDDRKAYATELMERLIVAQFDANGFHREHSPHYHFHVLATFEAVIESGWFASSDKIIRRVEDARAAQKWLVDPLRRPICVGDSVLVEQKSVVFPEAVGKDHLLSTFDDTGYAVLRSDWDVPAEDACMVFMMGGYHSKIHKHRDCLSFDWFDKGGRIVCDGGKYGYRTDKYRHHVLSCKAQNSAEIEGFDILRLKPYGSAILPCRTLSGGIYRLHGKLDFPAIKHERLLYCRPGRWVIVRDKLTYMRARNTTLWFHLETDFRLVSAKGNTLRAKGQDGRRIFVDCLNPEAQLEVQYGNEAEMKGFVSSHDNKLSPSLTVGFSVFGATHSVCTVLALDEDARSEAFRFASTHLGSTAKSAPATDSILPKVPHLRLPDPENLKLKSGKNTYGVSADGIDIAFFLDRRGRKEAGKLLIMLPGASTRRMGHMDFQRYGWSDDFPDHDVIAFTDPSLKPENMLGLGWFQHDKDAYGIDAMVTLIRRIIAQGGYDEADVMLFGSSGGGFSVLQLADALPKAKVVAINPQIFLHDYDLVHYGAMLETCYPGMTDIEVRERYLDRITVRLALQDREAPIYVFQNTRDVPHLENHLKPFIEGLDTDLVSWTEDRPHGRPNKMNVILFDDPDSDHAPPPREETVQMLKPLL